MNNLRTAGYIFLALCVIVIFASVQMNSVVRKQLELSEKDSLAHIKVQAYKKDPAKETAPVPQEKSRRIKPEDPAKYGMVVLSTHDSPATLNQWEAKLSALFEENRVLESKEAREALAQIKVDAREHAKQMQQLDKAIQDNEQKFKDNPLDTKTEEQLQNLYRVKAVGKILSGRVTMTSAPPAADVAEPATEAGSLQESPSPAPQL